MAIRTRPKNNKAGKVYETYFTYKNLEGITCRYSKSGFDTKKQAKEHEAIKKAELATTGEISLSKKLTFNEVFLEYMEVDGAKYAPSTFRYYFNTYTLYVKDSFIGNKDIFKIKYKELHKYFSDMSSLGYATQKNIKKIFNVTFKYALKASYIPSNPMLMIELRNNEEIQKKQKEITQEQFYEICRRVLEQNKHAPDHEANIWNNFVFYLALEIGWRVGLRISECLALVKSDVKFEENKIMVQRRLEYQGLKKDEMYLTERMKTKSSVAVLPLDDTLAELLKLWFRENPYEYIICDMEGRLIHPSTINFRFRNIGKQIGIDFHFHQLRHSLCSRLARNNIHPSIVKEIMRHSLVSTSLQTYTHINDEDKMNAIKKLK